MKRETASNNIIVQQDGYKLENPSRDSGCNSKDFARQLRALGQAIDKFGFSAFDLEIRDGAYLVIGKANPVEPTNFSLSRFVSECLRPLSIRPTRSGADHQVDLRFLPQDIEQFVKANDIRFVVWTVDLGTPPPAVLGPPAYDTQEFKIWKVF